MDTLFLGIFYAFSRCHTWLFWRESKRALCRTSAGSILKEEIKTALQQDQLLTKEGALKMAGISNATFLKAINEDIIKPQLIKGRKKAMYLESEVLRIEKKKRLSS
jgi:hypothetical protein